MTPIYLVVLSSFIIILLFLIRSFYLKYHEVNILKKASNNIADGYIIFTQNGKITNYNNKFLTIFKIKKKDINNKSINDLFKCKEFDKDELKKIVDSCENVKSTNEIIRFDIRTKNGKKIHNIEIKSIVNNDIFLRYVVVCKDVTSTYEIIEELNNNQEMVTSREKFTLLGQLISGIVYSLKSPIFVLSGELEAINNLIKEYEESVGDDTVTIEDHYEIAKDMENVLGKMKVQVKNISDSITAIRNHVVEINSDDEDNTFTINEMLKYIDILMKNTLKEYLIVLQFVVRVNKNMQIKGNLNVLVQAIDNLIMNSIESYCGKTNETIDIVIEKKDNKLAISVIDYGCGIPKRIQNKIFKEIITKEDSEKIGLGLFTTYSNIKSRI